MQSQIFINLEASTKVISGSLGLLRDWLHVRVDGVSSVAGSAATQPGVCWDSPPLGWLKYNVDAATFPEKGAISGVFRNKQGRFMGGYVKVLGSFTLDQR